MVGAAVALPPGLAAADVFKYVDGSGNVYFTDTPLKGNRYKLEWHREAKKLVRESKRKYANLSRGGYSRGKAYTSKSMQKRRKNVEHLVQANARRYRLPPALLHAVIRAESAYNSSAVSSAGAQGIMQLMPATAARYGVSDSFDPVENIRGGAAYLRYLLDLFDHDLQLAVAGYNAGEGAVMKYGRKIPPYAETQSYVRKVLQYYRAEQPASIVMTVR
ncbi:lytic transglycosylase domain-containing protein [Imhoffiella purpurea]|uniref:Putative soluble lytic murein transglycosylase n=1 Tax=Imhoffiella purpurea TaxID=1249627 RepID=W9VVN3_9GAMM|nr:lytic transglycosylase domain-containing protein [Imhoffiella purpurea]EXJ14490.1 Putative soluble lytic murein transglycosylase [Imhoffiella purpurea]